MTDPRPSRRIVFHGLSALGVATVLAGCGGEDDDAQPRAAEPSTTDSSTPTPSETRSRKPEKEEDKNTGARADALATTDEIPVGGGIILTGLRIVVTQPKRGEFRAFSAICTHQGQTVGRVEDNTITCLFHGSQYDATTGNVTTGPATAGLDPLKITVRSGRIVRA